MKSGIYKIINKINKKVYVGSTKNFGYRFTKHKTMLRKNNHSNKHLQSAWNKYKECNFRFIKLEETSEEKLIEREQYWMDKFNVVKEGYNMSEKAGRVVIKGIKHWNYGKKLSDETKRKISNAHNGIKHTEETKKKLSKLLKGRKAWNKGLLKELQPRYGKSKTESEKRKIGLASKGRKHTKESKLKIGLVFKGKKLSKEHKDKISKAMKGCKPWNIGLTKNNRNMQNEYQRYKN